MRAIASLLNKTPSNFTLKVPVDLKVAFHVKKLKICMIFAIAYLHQTENFPMLSSN